MMLLLGSSRDSACLNASLIDLKLMALLLCIEWAVLTPVLVTSALSARMAGPEVAAKACLAQTLFTIYVAQKAERGSQLDMIQGNCKAAADYLQRNCGAALMLYFNLVDISVLNRMLQTVDAKRVGSNMHLDSETGASRRQVLGATAGIAGLMVSPVFASPPSAHAAAVGTSNTEVTFTRTDPPEWLMAFWGEIDNKTWGDGFNCFAEDAVCNLGVADWHGRENIRSNLKKFIDTGFTAHHEVLEYWDSPQLKVFRGRVTMTPDKGGAAVRPTMTHFFYMSTMDPAKVRHWHGAVGPVSFR